MYYHRLRKRHIRDWSAKLLLVPIAAIALILAIVIASSPQASASPAPTTVSVSSPDVATTVWDFVGEVHPLAFPKWCLSSTGKGGSRLTLQKCGQTGYAQQWLGSKICNNNGCHGELILNSNRAPSQGGALGTWATGKGKNWVVLCVVGSTNCFSQAVGFLAEGKTGAQDALLIPWRDGAAVTWPRNLSKLLAAYLGLGAATTKSGVGWTHPKWRETSSS